jgi:hypothetical protein
LSCNSPRNCAGNDSLTAWEPGHGPRASAGTWVERVAELRIETDGTVTRCRRHRDGWMGTVHSRCYLQLRDRFPENSVQPTLIACADEVEGRAKEGRERFGFERHTTHWQEVIAAPDIQAVSIATPNYMHGAVVQAAAQAGKHVFCEKPVGRDLRDTAEMERVTRQAGVLTFVGYNYRWAPMVQYARQLLRKKTGQSHALSGPVFLWVRLQSAGRAFVAFRAESRRAGRLGRTDVACGRYGANAGRAGQAGCGQPRDFLRAPSFSYTGIRYTLQCGRGWPVGRGHQRRLRRRFGAILQSSPRQPGSLPSDPGTQVSDGF